MKKTEKKNRALTLNKETIRSLEQGALTAARGANSQNWSHCASECIPCDPDLTPPI